MSINLGLNSIRDQKPENLRSQGRERQAETENKAEIETRTETGEQQRIWEQGRSPDKTKAETGMD